jgi:hypothetical protein
MYACGWWMIVMLLICLSLTAWIASLSYDNANMYTYTFQDPAIPHTQRSCRLMVVAHHVDCVMLLLWMALCIAETRRNRQRSLSSSSSSSSSTRENTCLTNCTRLQCARGICLVTVWTMGWLLRTMINFDAHWTTGAIPSVYTHCLDVFVSMSVWVWTMVMVSFASTIIVVILFVVHGGSGCCRRSSSSSVVA